MRLRATATLQIFSRSEIADLGTSITMGTKNSLRSYFCIEMYLNIKLFSLWEVLIFVGNDFGISPVASIIFGMIFAYLMCHNSLISITRRAYFSTFSA